LNDTAAFHKQPSGISAKSGPNYSNFTTLHSFLKEQVHHAIAKFREVSNGENSVDFE